MMKNNERMTRWLLDAIDTEIAKPDGEADMALVEECTALLEELNDTSCTLSERELTKRCRAITRGKAGGKSAKKRVRLVAAIAACLAVFVFVCGCGYLPSINVILQTLFASGVGKDVEVHKVTYTYMYCIQSVVLLMKFPSSKINWKNLLMAVLLANIAFSIRPNVFYLFVPATGLVYLYKLIGKKELKKLTIGAPFVILAVTAVLFVINAAAYSKEGWKEFRDFFDVRTDVYDYYDLRPYGENPEL